MSSRIARWLARLSPGAWVILALAIGSSAMVFAFGRPSRMGMSCWIFNKVHDTTYRPFVERWNAAHPEAQVDLLLFHVNAYERRLLSAFTAGTPIGDILETERRLASRAFLGPDETIGYIDLTERLRAEGLFETINPTSFAPWTVRGRVYGIPRDVHPMLLCYRADIIEAAGIDMSTIETWDDFVRVLRPLMQDFDGDGRNDRFLLGGWPTNQMYIEGLLRQGGGRYFDEEGKLVLASELNAQLLAKLISWTAGPDRICTEVVEMSGVGYDLRIRGVVLCSLMPDWVVGQWKRDAPSLAGKVKLMPLPAFTPGGRRTSVWGGTMLGISRTAKDPEKAWEFAKTLYLSPELAVETFRGTGIVTPVKTLWNLPVFDEPDPYFCGQPSGRLFLNQAPHVPVRTSNPYERLALEKALVAAVALHQYAEREGRYAPEELVPEARRVLAIAEEAVKAHMARNAFFQP